MIPDDADAPAPELGPFEAVCPACHYTFHGPLLACPSCQENPA